jgi:hypothetical protein
VTKSKALAFFLAGGFCRSLWRSGASREGHPFLPALLILLNATSDREPMDNESLGQLGKIMASAKTDSRI